MKKLYKLLLIFAMMFYITSCSEKFLDLQPQQSISDDVFLKTFDDFQSAIIGGHDQLQSPSWYGRYFVLVPDIMGEDVKQNASANRAKEWAEYNGSETDFVPEDIWRELYEGINIANRLINSPYEPLTDLQTEFNNIIGQAYAIRALAHFNLVNMYGQHYTFTADASHAGIPIVLEFDVASKPVRNTVREVYDQVISDFTTAISLMTVNPSNAGLLSKEAAQALLSRVYLYKEDYANAESMASAVINSGKFSLVSNEGYATQFLDGNSSEAIFEINYGLTDNPGGDHLGAMYKESGYGDYLPADDLLNIMADGDVRKTMFLGDSNLQGIYASSRVNKFPSSGASISTDNIPVIRLSEVYLNRAEARAKASSPNVSGAQDDLNLIRQRGLATSPDVTATGTALIDEILLERRVELCFEGHRIFDINRNKQDVVRNNCTSTVCTITYPNDRFILPIPDGETNVNEFITQNPGY